MHRVDVAVLAEYDVEGRIRPLRVTWEDGSSFEIDRVLDVRPAASTKVGGAGIRYTVRIGRAETYLFLEENKWFVEAKDDVRTV